MMEGATKIPDPMTLPMMSAVASNRPSPRTSSGAAGGFTSGATEVLGRLGDVVLRREIDDLVEAPAGQSPHEGQRGDQEDPAQCSHSRLPSPRADGRRRRPA